MSITAINAVWDHSEAEANARLVVLALADNADEGGVCYPSHDLIARKSRISVRAVIDNIARLEQLGEVIVRREKGESNVYRIMLGDLPDKHDALHAKRGHLCRFCIGTSAGTRRRSARGGVQVDDADLHPNHKEPSVGTTKEVRARATPLPEDWEPDPEQVAKLSKDHPTIDVLAEVPGFRNYHHARDKRMVRWGPTFANWIRNAEKFSARDEARPNGRSRRGSFNPNDSWAGAEATV